MEDFINWPLIRAEEIQKNKPFYSGTYIGDEFPDYKGKAIDIADDHSDSKNPCYKIRFKGQNEWLGMMDESDFKTF